MLAGLTLAALLVAAMLSGRFGRPAAAALGMLSVAWLFVNKPMEGPLLVPVSSTHGLVAADLVGITGLLLAAALLIKPLKSRVK
jgi:hypothetical protein